MSCVGCIYTIKTKKDAECTCSMIYNCNTASDRPAEKEKSMKSTSKN